MIYVTIYVVIVLKIISEIYNNLNIWAGCRISSQSLAPLKKNIFVYK